MHAIPDRRSRTLLLACLLAGCASTPAPAPTPTAAAPSTPAPPAPVPEIRPGLLAGYLGKALPDSLALLPPPPAPGSTAFRHDEAVARAMQALRGTPRYAQATLDADLAFPHAAGTFACALGIPVTEQDTPRLYVLLRRVETDAGLGTYGAKDKYDRVRPFVHFNEGTCAPADEAALRKDGSYPSGHTSIGWAWALVLTELAPDRRDAVLARGRSFGESRLVCNAHWQSDVLEGRAVGAGVVADLHSDATFTADMAAAKDEIAAARQRGAAPDRDCAAEAAALAGRLPGVL